MVDAPALFAQRLGCADCDIQMKEETMSRKSMHKGFNLACAAQLCAVATVASAADAALERAAQAMGANGLKSLRYSGDGVGYTFGQAYMPGLAWPKIALRSFVRTVNYETGSMRDEVLYQRAEALGGGGYPHAAPQRDDRYVSGAFAWNVVGNAAAPGPRFVADRMHQLWITPQGVIMAAVKNNATVHTETRDGKTMSIATFTEPGRFRAIVFIGPNGFVDRVESRFPDPVLGDTLVVTTYSDYRPFGNVSFPSRITQAQGGFPILDLTVRDVQSNAPADIQLPDTVKSATERVAVDKVADGVWFLGGGSHNSVAIAMKDYMILVETPLNDDRSLAVIAEVKKLAAGKPIRYVVNSHVHFDHSGGLRAAVAEGATIVTHSQNKAYYEKAFGNANTISPDALAKSGKKPKFVTVDDKYTIKDGTRTVELYHVADSHHSDNFLMVYLPKERLLIEADSFTPPPPNTPPPAQLNPLHVNLVDNLATRNLPIDKILPLHGRVVPSSELYSAVGQPQPK
jgi:glyoxylase-like metal-dependent hydrolase (beta-lactamase superfamily II)